jgi:hypothetical protein
VTAGLKFKTVGHRKSPVTPEACFQRASLLQRQAERLNPFPRPRGFVFKAKTYEDYARWRSSQPNPRLW